MLFLPPFDSEDNIILTPIRVIIDVKIEKNILRIKLGIEVNFADIPKILSMRSEIILEKIKSINPDTNNFPFISYPPHIIR